MARGRLVSKDRRDQAMREARLKRGYLLELCRYVVLNPVRARMVGRAQDYKWSSYRATAGLSSEPGYLSCDWILAQFGRHRSVAQKRYRAFVVEGIKAPSPWRRLEAQVILGSAAFIAKLKRPAHGIREVRREQRFLGRPSLGGRVGSDQRSALNSLVNAVNSRPI